MAETATNLEIDDEGLSRASKMKNETIKPWTKTTDGLSKDQIPGLEALTAKNGLILITSREQLHGETARGAVNEVFKSLTGDIILIPHLPKIATGCLRDLIKAAITSLVGIDNGTDLNDSDAAYQEGLLLLPGFLAPNSHLTAFRSRLNGFSRVSPRFTLPSLTRRVMDDAETIAEELLAKGEPVNILGHSRAGLVALCVLRLLEKKNMDSLIQRLLLLSPVASGMRPEILPFARSLRIASISDLCPGSEAIRFWQGLGPQNRAKITVISPKNGDAFTCPETSFVDGGAMLLTPDCSHQNQVLNPDSHVFKAAMALIQNC